jgi:hypothetical protein
LLGVAGNTFVASPQGQLTFSSGNPGAGIPNIVFGSWANATSNASGGFDVDNDASTTPGTITGVIEPLFLVNNNATTINDGAPVKMSATANQVTFTTTTDTGGGVVLGVNIGACANAAVCHIATTGFLRAKMTLGTGTCAIGNSVIVDTTTNQRVKCAAYSAGTSIGVVTDILTNTVGNPISVAIGLR